MKLAVLTVSTMVEAAVRVYPNDLNFVTVEKELAGQAVAGAIALKFAIEHISGP